MVVVVAKTSQCRWSTPLYLFGTNELPSVSRGEPSQGGEPVSLENHRIVRAAASSGSGSDSLFLSLLLLLIMYVLYASLSYHNTLFNLSDRKHEFI